MPRYENNLTTEAIKDIIETQTVEAESDGLYHPPGPHVHKKSGNDTVIGNEDHVQHVHQHSKST